MSGRGVQVAGSLLLAMAGITLGVVLGKCTASLPPMIEQRRKALADSVEHAMLEWEPIARDTWRLRVVNGWLVRTGESVAPVFVPDSEHSWELPLK